MLWWELTVGLLVATISGVLSGALVIQSNQYQALGFQSAALYSFQAGLNQNLYLILLITGVVCGVTALCVVLKRPRIGALMVGLLPALYIIFEIGYGLNRYDFKAFWKEPRDFLGLPLRAGFFESQVILANIGVLALAVLAAWIAFRVTLAVIRRAGSRIHTMKQPFRPYLLVLPVVVAIVGFNIFCISHRSRNRAAGPNVVLISLDTLRADHLGCYGYHRDTSPNIDRIAESSILFENAITQAAWTLPSHKAVLTGLLPPSLRHGVDQTVPLDTRRVTLAEILLDAGYRTAAFAHGLSTVTPRFGFAQGFETYFVPAEQLIPGDGPAEVINDRAISWLDKHGKERFFLFLHYADIHSDADLLPYEVPEPYGTMFAKEVGGGFVKPKGRPGGSLYLLDISAGRVNPSPREIEYVAALYDGGIRYTDVYIGALVDELSRRGVLDDTILVIMSDHGEEFREHGKMLHGRTYRETAHVPLILRFPEAAWHGVRIPTQVRLIDIVPTVLDYLGLPTREDMHGASLLPLAQEGGPSRPAYTEGGNSYGVRANDWLLVTDLDLKNHEVYDTVNDPGETLDLAGEFPQREDMLARALAGIVSLAETGRQQGAEGKPTRLDRRTKEALKALGYINQGG